MNYSYIIAGRRIGVVQQVEYAGVVDANTQKEAIIKALANEFGDPDISDPIIALTDSGWIDHETLTEQYAALDLNARTFELDTGEHSFTIRVTGNLPEPT